jgi:hypothetical protein
MRNLYMWYLFPFHVSLQRQIIQVVENPHGHTSCSSWAQKAFQPSSCWARFLSHARNYGQQGITILFDYNTTALFLYHLSEMPY